MNSDKIYKINVDGECIEKLTLTYEQYSTQKGRNKVRNAFAEKYNISTWGVRLVCAEKNHIFCTDMKTGKSYRKYI